MLRGEVDIAFMPLANLRHMCFVIRDFYPVPVRGRSVRMKKTFNERNAFNNAVSPAAIGIFPGFIDKPDIFRPYSYGNFLINAEPVRGSRNA